jgi:hypothetical protein
MEMETTPIRPQIQQKQPPKNVTFATDIEFKKENDEGEQPQANNPQVYSKYQFKNSQQYILF